MTFEILDINLYGGLKQRAEEVYLKKLTCQILNALVTIDSLNIIHCDIKMRTYSAIQEVFGSKLIDFESSCFTDQQIYSYIQSRYYRAPEVTLQMPYTSTIGIWSMVCVLVKCILENHLKGSIRQFYSILRYLPPTELIQKGKRSQIYFDSSGALRSHVNKKDQGILGRDPHS